MLIACMSTSCISHSSTMLHWIFALDLSNNLHKPLDPFSPCEFAVMPYSEYSDLELWIVASILTILRLLVNHLCMKFIRIIRTMWIACILAAKLSTHLSVAKCLMHPDWTFYTMTKSQCQLPLGFRVYLGHPAQHCRVSVSYYIFEMRHSEFKSIHNNGSKSVRATDNIHSLEMNLEHLILPFLGEMQWCPCESGALYCKHWFHEGCSWCLQLFQHCQC